MPQDLKPNLSQVHVAGCCATMGITRMRDIQQVESDALLVIQEWALEHFAEDHQFTAADIQTLHRQWLGDIYEWAGEFRSVNMAKGDFLFAAAAQVPRLMREFEREELGTHTCQWRIVNCHVKTGA